MISRRSQRRSIRFFTSLSEFGFYFLLFCLPLFRGAVYPVERILFSLGFLLCWLFLEFSSYLKNGRFFHSFRAKEIHHLVPLLLLSAVWIHTMVISSKVEESLIRAWDFTSLFVVFQITRELFLTKQYRVRFFIFLFILALFYTLLGWAHSFEWLDHPWWETAEFHSGPFVNHNHFAGFLCLLLFSILGILLAQRSRYLLHLGVFWLLIFSLFLLTLSRGAWISFFITFFLLGLVLYREQSLQLIGKRLLTGVIVVLIGFAAFIGSNLNPQMSQRALSMFQPQGRYEFLDFRVKLWASTIEAIQQRPLLGYGLGAFEWEMRPFRRKGFEFAFDYAHNDWLQYFMEMGLILSSLFLLYLSLILKKTYQRFRSSRLHEFRFEELGLLCAVLCLLIHSTVDFNLQIFGNTVFFVLFLGLLSQGEETNGSNGI